MFSMMTMILGRTEAEAKAKYADYRRPHQSRGRADADVRLDRRRFLDLRPRPASSPRRERRRPHRDGQHHPRRSGPGLDRARGRPACRHRRHRAGAWSARPKRSPTRSRPGSIRPMSTASTSPFAVSPGDFEDIVDMLVPELVRRGRYKTSLSQGNVARKAVRRRAARGSQPRIRRHAIAMAPMQINSPRC